MAVSLECSGRASTLARGYGNPETGLHDTARQMLFGAFSVTAQYFSHGKIKQTFIIELERMKNAILLSEAICQSNFKKL